MAVSPSVLLASHSGSNANSYNTASVSPTANKLLLLSVVNRITGSSPNTPSVSGNGLTWVLVQSRDFFVSQACRLSVFRAMGPAPSTGVITISFAGETQNYCGWILTEWDGIDTSGTDGSGAVVQDAGNDAGSSDATSITVTLAAFGSANNATYGTFVSGSAAGITPGSGFSQLADVVVESNDSHFVEWRVDNDTTVDATAALAGFGGIAIEIKAVASAVSTPSTAALVLTTFPPAIRIGTIVIPSTASLSIVTFAVSLAQGVGTTPDTVALTTTAFEPTVSITSSALITPSTAMLVATGFEPAATLSNIIVPSVASLLLTTLSLVTIVNYLIIPGLAVLIITTTAPDLTLSPAPTPIGEMWAVIYSGSTSIATIPHLTATRIEEGANRLGIATFTAPRDAVGISSAAIGKEMGIWRTGEGEIFRGFITDRRRTVSPDNLKLVGFEVFSRGIELQRKQTWRGILLDDVVFQTALNTVLTGSGWTAISSGTLPNITKRFDNMTVLEALNELASIGNAYWRETHVSRQIEFRQIPAVTGMSMANLRQATFDSSVGIIEDIENIQQDLSALANRIVPESKVDGDNIVTLQESTRTTPYIIKSLVKINPSITNIVEYAFIANGEDHDVEIECNGNNRALVILIVTDSGVSNDGPKASVKVNGRSPKRFVDSDGPGHALRLFTLGSPQNGKNTITFNVINNTGIESHLVAVALQDVDQTLGNEFFTDRPQDQGISTTPSVTVDSVSGDTVIDFVIHSTSGSISPGAGQTEELDSDTTFGVNIAVSREIAVSASTVMSWTKTISSDWYQLGMNVKPAKVWYIENTTSQATYGIHELFLPLGTFIKLTSVLANIANAMYDYTVDYLIKHKDPGLLYDIHVAYLPIGPLGWLCGDSIRTIYRDEFENIDAALIVIERIQQFDDTGARHWALSLSDKVQFRIDEKGLWLLEQLRSRVAAIQINQT